VNTLNGYIQEVCPVSRPLKRESARLAKSKADGGAKTTSARRVLLSG